MMEKVHTLAESGVVSEEMTSHPIMTGTLMNIPNNYRGLAKVTKVRDEQAKNWIGTDMPFYVDMESGETNLLQPNGQMATVADISRWFDLEMWTPHP
jgi:hypothetical protein